MGIRQKFLLSIVLGLGAFLSLLMASFYAQHQLVIDAYMGRSRTVVGLGLSMLQQIEDRRLAGQISLQQAQREARDVLNHLRYDGGNYLFALDGDGTMLVNPARPQLVGTNLAEDPDDIGANLGALAQLASEKGEATVSYVFPRIYGGKALEKTTYGAVFRPWGWLIGSGVYVEDAEAAFQDGARQMAVIAVPLTGILLLVVFLLARSVAKSVGELAVVVEGVTQHRFDQPIPHTGRSDELGKLARAVAALQHVAGMEDELRRSRDLVASVFDASQEAAAVCDVSGRIQFVSAALCRMSGYDAGWLEGKTLDVLRSGHQDDEFFDQVDSHLERYGDWEGDVWYRRANGEVLVVHKRVTAIRDQDGQVVTKVVIMRDVVERGRHQRSQRYLPQHDPLTNLADRHLLSQRLTRSLVQTARTGRQTALLVVDVDEFAKVNRDLGMVGGDEVLRFLALRLMQAVRSSDTVARLDGDEYAVLMEDVQSSDEIRALAGRILDAMRAPVAVGGKTCAITVSIGAALAPDHGHGETRILRAAQEAMENARQDGGDRVVWASQDAVMVG